jgi:hypothetical protein
VKAVWNGQVIAEANDTVVVDGNHYFPLHSVKKEFLENSSNTSVCPWKGLANYFSLNVEGKKNEDAAWYYSEPSKTAQQVKGRSARRSTPLGAGRCARREGKHRRGVGPIKERGGRAWRFITLSTKPVSQGPRRFATAAAGRSGPFCGM